MTQPRILVLSDDGLATGFGRIAMEVNTRLVRRGYHILAASLQYDGLLPAYYEGTPLPYHVASLNGHVNWLDMFAGIAAVYTPDVVMVCQDAPFGVAIRSLPLDWSKTAFVMVTPVDGAPVSPEWAALMRKADAGMTISRFGVEAYRQADVAVDLLPCGVDTGTFYPVTSDQRAALRAKLNIPADAFVLMTAAQNQGRKAISAMLEGFFEFAKGRNAYYLLDMDPASPVGWNIPVLCQQYGWDASKLIFRADAQRAGLTHLRDRYNVADAHAVISHREGWGFPLVEAMACGVVSMALDYCSGTEICGDGRGVLVKPIDHTEIGAWGGARDYFPDVRHFVAELTRLYENPLERQIIAAKGMAWARQQTWDAAADAVQAVLEDVLAKRRAMAAPDVAPQSVIPSTVSKEVQLVEG
jgi:glycosyltransferase involved in cell wall biosynthesis